jgi:hypothetical protein
MLYVFMLTDLVCSVNTEQGEHTEPGAIGNRSVALK